MDLFNKKKIKDLETRIVNLENISNSTGGYLISLARLSFVKPEVLVREFSNAKSNLEYIEKLTKIRNAENGVEKKNK